MDSMQRVLAAALALVPGGLAVLAAVRIITEHNRRRRAEHRPRGGGGGRGWSGGVREPRRPLHPWGAGAIALALPEDPALSTTGPTSGREPGRILIAV